MSGRGGGARWTKQPWQRPRVRRGPGHGGGRGVGCCSGGPQVGARAEAERAPGGQAV